MATSYRIMKNARGVETGVVLTCENGLEVYIWNDPDNADWRAYQEWLADGNTAAPADAE